MKKTKIEKVQSQVAIRRQKCAVYMAKKFANENFSVSDKRLDIWFIIFVYILKMNKFYSVTVTSEMVIGNLRACILYAVNEDSYRSCKVLLKNVKSSVKHN